MDPKKLLKHLVILMFFIFLVDRIGVTLYWYFTIWWFDMVMHFVSGLWTGLFFAYVFYIRKPIFSNVFYIILLSFLIGVSWEIFELYVFNHIGGTPFNLLDTVSDIFFDVAGATLAALYVLKLNNGNNS